MSDLIPIKLAEAALAEQEKQRAQAITLAKQLAELTERKGLFYSKESQAQADAIIKQIRSL